MSEPSGPQPFSGEPRAWVVLPERDPTLGGEVRLLELERAGFEAELGAPVEFVTTDPRDGARWVLVVDPDHAGPAETTYDPAHRQLVSRAADTAGLFEAMSLGRSAARAGEGTFLASDCSDVDEAIARVVEETEATYPGFELRGLDWQSICERHIPEVRAADDPLPAFQRWLAELEDGHTWVWSPLANLPYAARVDDRSVTFARVREGTSGHAAGIRAGWSLVAIDGLDVDGGDWLSRAAAPSHARALIAGRRLLAGPAGVLRALTARSPDGESVTWSEAPSGPADPLVTWTGLDRDTGYVRVDTWITSRGVDEALDAAFSELRTRETLVLDIRGNPGGNLVLATRTRDRFLRRRTELGAIRYSIDGGGLSDPARIVGEPSDEVRRWPGRLVVMTDSLTFSSSEDFLLGLQGLAHVTVVGSPTGGGSGRARALRLLPGMTLTISTALTYDRSGRCIEGAGIPVDVEIVGPDDEVLTVARGV